MQALCIGVETICIFLSLLSVPVLILLVLRVCWCWSYGKSLKGPCIKAVFCALPLCVIIFFNELRKFDIVFHENLYLSSKALSGTHKLDIFTYFSFPPNPFIQPLSLHLKISDEITGKTLVEAKEQVIEDYNLIIPKIEWIENSVKVTNFDTSRPEHFLRFMTS